MDWLTLLPQILSIFALAWVSFWPAILAGLALGLPPALVIVTATLSYASGAALVALVGGRLREWITRRWGGKALLTEGSLLERVWKRFGAVGLGLAAPMTVGAQAGALIGLALNIPPRRLTIWLAVGGLVWALILTVGVVAGVLVATG
jgi:hypothetical protein